MQTQAGVGRANELFVSEILYMKNWCSNFPFGLVFIRQSQDPLDFFPPPAIGPFFYHPSGFDSRNV
jgi:hypothetical protein